MVTPASSEISSLIWNEKYRYNNEPDLQATYKRVSSAVYAKDNDFHRLLAYTALINGEFVPGGRILAGAGTSRAVTMTNCFMSQEIEDSSEGIWEAFTNAMLTLRQGGGIGMNFSPIRPKGAFVKGVEADASGPLSYMHVWNSGCQTILSAGRRRGAMMAVLSVDHPDVIDFIKVKHEKGVLTNFNLSVLITDAFMRAVKSDQDWDLGFSIPPFQKSVSKITERNGHPWYVYQTVKAKDLFDLITGSTYEYSEPGVIFIDRINQMNNLNYCEKIIGTNPCQPDFATVLTPEGIKTFKDVFVGSTIWSGKKWTTIVSKIFTGNKPVFAYFTSNGVFIGTENHEVFEHGKKVQIKDAKSIDSADPVDKGESFPILNSKKLGIYPVSDITVDCDEHSYWTGGLLVSNCGEQVLPAYGNCTLGHINLSALVKEPWTHKAWIDYGRMREVVQIAVRFLDNVLSTTNFPFELQKQEALNKRRIGIGITGFATALQMVAIKYGSEQSIEIAHTIGKILRDSAYSASSALAKERGCFPLFERDLYLTGNFLEDLPDEIREEINHNGIRNGVLLSIAPVGTTSLLNNNISSGIEPVFAFSTKRKIRDNDGIGFREVNIVDYGYAQLGIQDEEDRPAFMVKTSDLKPEHHLNILSVFQKYVDSSISKTINCPEDMNFENFRNVYLQAYESGCKACSTYRPSSVRGSIIEDQNRSKGKLCSSCKVGTMISHDGCWFCDSCGFSMCEI